MTLEKPGRILAVNCIDMYLFLVPIYSFPNIHILLETFLYSIAVLKDYKIELQMYQL